MAQDKVREQYEALPYPERDPADEAKRLITGSPSELWELNHYVFGGARDWSQPFAALVAGGGTGDGAIMLAQQLADIGSPGTVLHLDISAASQAIARQRADQRGLANIEFALGSLTELSHGPFDYIDCCGVLHHLEDPAAGLASLTGALAPDGGIGLMVYGELGRIGVYHVQEALRTLAPVDLDPAARLDIARRLLGDLPETNWLSRNDLVGDHLNGGDAGLFDLLLHTRDRAYRVGALAAMVAAADLRITGFIEPIRYRPAQYLDDPKLRRAAAGTNGQFDMLAQAALAELLAGNMIKHTLYAVRDTNDIGPPDPNDPHAATAPAGLVRRATSQRLAARRKARGRVYGRRSNHNQKLWLAG